MRARTAPLTGERGSVTVWMLGLCVMVLFVGGLSLDLWRAFSQRRALAGMADAAAVAGAGAVDETAWRTTGTVRLDPDRAAALARRSLASQPGAEAVLAAAVRTGPRLVAVDVSGEVGLTLPRVLLADEPLTVSVSARAAPVSGD
ncbi:MAG: hypothetical protein KY434_02875 [Actinobacteria bacterium]|nr:hypothetical protein [Actinomycetota bacterium]